MGSRRLQVVLFLSLDEAAMLHDRAGDALRGGLGRLWALRALLLISLQLIAGLVFSAELVSQEREEGTATIALVGAGVGGGLVGFIGGAALGDWVAGGDDIGLGAGAILGTSAALPLAIHLANGRHGDLGQEVLTSVGIGVGGVAIMFALAHWGFRWRGFGTRAVLLAFPLAIPAAQIAATIAAERDGQETGSAAAAAALPLLVVRIPLE